MDTRYTKPVLPLVTIFVVGVSFRLGVALSLGDVISELPGVHDQRSYDTLARQVVGGHGFGFAASWWPATRAGEPTAHWSFLYTLYLAGTYALFGEHPLIARLIQAVVAGVLYPWLTWRIGRCLLGERAGLAAAGLAAVYGYFVYYAGALMTETFYILAILWATDLALGIARAPTVPVHPTRAGVWRFAIAARPWLLLGLALGIAALLRQLVLLFVPVLFAWLLWARVGSSGRLGGDGTRSAWRPLLGGFALAMIVVALLIAPWTARNYQVFGRLVLLNTNAGYAFFWANHPIHGTDFVSILPGGTYQRLIPPELRALDEAALDQALLREGLRFVVEDPGRYALLSLSRVKDYFQFWPSAESSTASNIVRLMSFGIYLPLMFYGLVLAALRRRELQAAGRWQGIVLIYAFVTVYSLIHLLSWALIRYRLPVDAALMPFAGLAVADLAQRLVAARRRRWQAPGVARRPTPTVG